MTGAIRETAASVRDKAASVGETAAEATARLRHKVSDTADASLQAAARVRDQATDFGQRASRNVTQTVSNNPLLVAGIGLVVGGLIASAIPRLRAEKQVFGAAGRKLREQAEDTINQGLETVKQKGRDVYQSAVGAAEQEGLTPDKLGDQVRDIGERARKVADAAVSTFESPSQNKH